MSTMAMIIFINLKTLDPPIWNEFSTDVLFCMGFEFCVLWAFAILVYHLDADLVVSLLCVTFFQLGSVKKHG